MFFLNYLTIRESPKHMLKPSSEFGQFKNVENIPITESPHNVIIKRKNENKRLIET